MGGPSDDGNRDATTLGTTCLWSATAGGLAIVAIFFNHPAQRPAPQVFHGAHAAVDVVGYSSNGTLIDGTLAVRMLS